MRDKVTPYATGYGFIIIYVVIAIAVIIDVIT